MKKKLPVKLFSFLFFTVNILSAQSFISGSFIYSVTSETEVSLVDYSSKPTGDLIIPSTVTDNGNTYVVTSIGDLAFISCSEVTTVSIPNSVTIIGESAFEWCTGLTTLSIPNGVTTIGNYAFSSCTGLTTLSIPNSVTSINYSAFGNCPKLTTLNIPNSVTTIGNWAFAYCSALTTLSIPDSVTSIGEGVFAYCTGLTTLSIPNSVTTIGNTSFLNCLGLNTLHIPTSVTSIGNYAFADCDGLITLSIPDSVTSIGDGVFQNCTGLTEVKVNWATPLAINSSVFENINLSSVALNMPTGTATLYEVADVWKDFSFIKNDGNLSVNSYQLNSSVILYPNPAKDYIRLSGGLVEKESYFIYNTVGAKIKTGSVSNDEKIDTQNLPKGTYLLKRENGNSIKFLKE